MIGAFGDQLTIIGAGGIMTGSDALEMKQAGADSIEVYSAFIYSGPGVLKDMARAWITVSPGLV